MRAVGIKEGTGNIDNGLSSPFKNKPGLLCYTGKWGRLQILLGSILEELVLILGRDDNSHALLGFGNGELCAVEAFIFLRDQIKVDLKTVGELSDRNGDSARAEVIALFDEAGNLGTAEKTLKLTLCGSISLLHFRAAGSQRLLGVGLGGSRSAADAVASGASAQQDDDIAGVGIETLHILTRSSAHDRADLHALGKITGMIYFGDMTGGKTDLVAVARISVRSADDQLFLGKLAADGL